MSQIIFYVNIIDGRFSKKESFMDLIHAHERTDSGSAPQILKKLLLDGTDIKKGPMLL
jgi:hypothetical protein